MLLLVPLILFLSTASALPTQQVLSDGTDDNAEAGWIDPRLNGGRLLDVKCSFISKVL